MKIMCSTSKSCTEFPGLLDTFVEIVSSCQELEIIVENMDLIKMFPEIMRDVKIIIFALKSQKELQEVVTNNALFNDAKKFSYFRI